MSEELTLEERASVRAVEMTYHSGIVGWKCKWCNYENTSIYFACLHMRRKHPTEIKEVMNEISPTS